MKIPFPTMPVFDLHAWNHSLSATSTGIHKVLMETFIPYAYFQLDQFKARQDWSQGFNDLFNRFLTSLDSRNRRPFPDFVRELNSEGGFGPIYFADGFIHMYSKLFFYDSVQDYNVRGYSGVLICNHLDQRSQVYGVLRVAEAFASWLKKENIAFTLFLRKVGEDDDVEIA